jgi:YHS domain-containing protein
MSKKSITISGLLFAAAVFGLISCGSASNQQDKKTEIRGSATDPVCGMTVEKDAAASKGLTADYMGTTYYFCRTEDRDTFIKNPSAFVKASSMPASPKTSMTAEPAMTAGAEAQNFTCPVCGMSVDTSTAKKNNLVVSFKGKEYYFCSASDKETFLKEPEKYIK